jgi:PAS domain S-box-containing protein
MADDSNNGTRPEDRLPRSGSASAAARAGEERFDELTDTLLDIVYEFDLTGQIVYANQAAVEAFVPEGGKATDVNVRSTMAKKDLAKSKNDIESIFRGNRVVGERTFVRADGRSFIGEVHSGPVYDEQGKVCGVRGVIRDITDRKKAEQRIRESEARFRTLFDLSPQPVVVSEPETGRIIDVNDKFCELSGYSKQEVLGRPSVELGLYAAEQRTRFYETFRREGEVSGLEMTFTSKDGHEIETLMFSRAVEVTEEKLILTVVVDVTETRRLERNLRQARKMEALGQLAGGLAHDFNNLLMAIQANTSLMATDPACRAIHEGELRDIEHAVKSGSKLIRQLLGFTSQTSWQPVPTDINELVGRTAEMFGRTNKRIRLVESHDPRPCVCVVDGVQIEQAVLNLLINASQAMEDGGEVYIRTSLETLDRERVRPFSISPGEFVTIEISDTGAGMDSATKERVFEPFFTTKATGRGTGLGLASAYGIVKRHGGMITVESSPGHGSVFSIHLPTTEERPLAGREEREPLMGGDETILLVDDEAIVRRAAGQMLKRLGYEPVLAESGRQAVRIIEERGDEIALVMLDMVMPEMDGHQTLAEIRKRRPGIKVLMSSGFDLVRRAEKGSEEKGDEWDGVLPKPYTLKKLAAKLRQVLDGEPEE